MLRLLFIGLLGVLLSACTATPAYRGVTASKWQQLNASERQLIIDQSYQQQVGGSS